MKKKIILSIESILQVFLMFFLSVIDVSAQNVLYEENFGNPTSNTLIQNYFGWQNNTVIYSGNGTCDVRSTNSSSGYFGSSGGGNVMINDTVKWFQISGINTVIFNTQTQDLSVSLLCGLRKVAKENGSSFVVQYSVDSVEWHGLAMFDTLPTGTGTSGWYKVMYQGLPECPNLHLRFSNTTMSDYRLDDIVVKADYNGVQQDVDTSLAVELPFDISGNSSGSNIEVKSIPGFTALKLGTSYADGAAKFEGKNAGQAMLTAHLDSAPDSLFFDLQGRKAGTPSSYSGVLFAVLESDDGTQWNEVAILNEDDIGVGGYSHFGGFKLNHSTRFVRWMLQECGSGNTQLNNIRVTKHMEDPQDDVSVPWYMLESRDIVVYPNPAANHLRFTTRLFDRAEQVILYDLYGKILKRWHDVASGDLLDVSDVRQGSYVLCFFVSSSSIVKKIFVFK